MRLGIDVRHLTRPLTGIGHYIFDFCKTLARGAYRPFSVCSIPIDGFLSTRTAKSNDTYILCDQSCWPPTWSETVLPWQLYRDEVDVFWGPAHRLPIFMPRSVKTLVTIHDLVWKYFPETMKKTTWFLDRFYMPLSIKKANRILTISFATKEALIREFHVPVDKTSVIYPIIKNIKDTDRKESPFKNHILFVGTLEPRKNLIRLLQAYALLPIKLRERYPLVIVGGKGWGDINLESMIHSLNLDKYAKLLGYVDEDTLRALYAQCVFLAFPSLYEGFGLPIVEAMQHKKPILTSKSSSMMEVGYNVSVFIDPYSVGSIHDGLVELLENNKKREQLSLNIEKEMEKFNQKKMFNEFLNILSNP